MRTSIKTLMVVVVLLVIPFVSPLTKVVDAGLIHFDGGGHPDLRRALSLLWRDTGFKMFFNTSSDPTWIDCSNRLSIGFTDGEDGHRKFTMTFDSYITFFANYRINISIQDCESFNIDTVNKTFNIIKPRYTVSFNYSDINRIPNLIFRWGMDYDVFWFTVQRNHIRNVHIVLDPTVIITNVFDGGFTSQAWQRLTTRSHNGTLFSSFVNGSGINTIFKSFDNGSTWTETAFHDVVGWVANTPAPIVCLSNNTLVVAHPNGNWVNFTFSEDFGTTWSAEKQVSNGTRACYDLTMAINEYDDIYFCPYGKTDGSTTYNQVWIRSWNWSTGFSTVKELTTVAESGNINHGPVSVAVDAFNNVHLAYRRGTQYIYYVWFNYSSSTWSSKISVYYTTPTLRLQYYPVVAVHSSGVGFNLTVRIAFHGRYSITTTLYRERVSTSYDYGATWTSVVINAYETTQGEPSLSIAANGEAFITWHGRNSSTSTLYKIWESHTVGMGNSWTAPVIISSLDPYNDVSTSQLFSTWPVLDGLVVGRPRVGMCMIYTDDYNVTYYYSSDISFDVHRLSNVSLSGWYPGNNTYYSTLYLRMPLLWFNVTVEDDVGYQTKVVFWVDGHRVYTSGYGANRTVSVNLSSVWYGFNFTLGDKYNFTVNASDTRDEFVNVTRVFSYVGDSSVGVMMMVGRVDYSYVLIGGFAGLFFGSIFTFFRKKKR